MLSLTINNKSVQLSESKSILCKWRNPACNFKEFPGDRSQGIQIPVTPYNRALLGNPERFEKLIADGDNKFADAILRSAGYPLISGKLIIESADDESYSGWIQGTVGTIGDDFREKYIYDVFAFNQLKNFENKANYNPLTDDYGCPKILNPNFFYDKGPKEKYTRMVPNPDYVPGLDLRHFTNNFPYIPEEYETEALTEAFRKTAEYYINQLNPDSTVKISESQAYYHSIDTDLDVYVVSPMLFLNYLLKEIFKTSGFYIDNNALADDEDLQKLMLYNNYDITTIYFTLRGPFGIIFDWYSGEQRSNFKAVDYIIRKYDGFFQYKNLIPKVQLKEFLLGLQNLLNICFFPRNDSRVDIIDREQILSGTAFDLSSYMVGNWLMGEKKDTTLKFIFDHDRDDIFFQENWEDLDDFRDNEGDPVDDWEDLEAIYEPAIDEIRYIKNKNVYAQYKWMEKEEENPGTGEPIETEVLGWEKVSHGFQNGYYNRGKAEEEEIKTVFSTLMNAQPTTAQRGTIKSKKFAYQNFTPRLLFYLGNNLGKFETDNISLDWEKETTGLLETRWPLWAKFWSRRQPVTGKARLPLNVLDYVIRNIPYKFRSREGEFIIEEMQCEFRNNEIGITEFKGYKVDVSPPRAGLDMIVGPSDIISINLLIDFTEAGTYELVL